MMRLSYSVLCVLILALTACQNSANLDVEPEPKADSLLTKAPVAEAIMEEELLDSLPPDTLKKSGRPTLDPPKLVFVKTKQQFDTLVQDSILLRDFEFRNEGVKALEIFAAESTCGCTSASYPFVLIGPGEKGKITMRFDSKGRQGKQKAQVKVKSNAEEPEIILSLEGFVREKY